MTTVEDTAQTTQAPSFDEGLERIKGIMNALPPEDRREVFLRLIDQERVGSPELAKLEAARAEVKRASDFCMALSRFPRSPATEKAARYAADEADHACSWYSVALTEYRDINGRGAEATDDVARMGGKL